MSTDKKIPAQKTIAKTILSTTPQNYRARIVFKSGAVQDYLAVIDNTIDIENMRDAYDQALKGKSPTNGTFSFGKNTKLTIDWKEVAALQTWQD
jgi:hypothetical protein